MKYISLVNLNRFFDDLKVWAAKKFIPKSKEKELITETDLGNIDASLYDATATYEVNEYVIYDKKLYRCTTAISVAEEWNALHWTLAKSTDIFQGSASGLVPAAESGDADKVLKGDGTWGEAGSSVRVSYDAQTEELHMDFSPPLTVNIGGDEYPVVQIANKLWTKSNLNTILTGISYNTGGDFPIGAHCWYYNKDTQYENRGLLYTYQCLSIISGALPEGWRIATLDDFDTLFKYCGSQNLYSNNWPGDYAWKLKSELYWINNSNITNETGFTWIPTGRRVDKDFVDITSGFLWTSTNSGSGKYVVYLNDDSDSTSRNKAWLTSGSDYYDAYAIRLVRDF